jgi:hypothetical protein
MSIFILILLIADTVLLVASEVQGSAWAALVCRNSFSLCDYPLLY